MRTHLTRLWLPAQGQTDRDRSQPKRVVRSDRDGVKSLSGGISTLSKATASLTDGQQQALAWRRGEVGRGGGGVRGYSRGKGRRRKDEEQVNGEAGGLWWSHSTRLYSAAARVLLPITAVRLTLDSIKSGSIKTMIIEFIRGCTPC